MLQGESEENSSGQMDDLKLTRREFLKQASSVAAVVAVNGVSGLSLLADNALTGTSGGMCSGRVLNKLTGKPIGGVLVSDGVSIVRTDHAGRYALKISPHVRPIVYITTPDGYRLDPDGFWKRVNFRAGRAKVNFFLSPRKSVRKFTFVQVTDTHHVVGTHSSQDIATFIRDVHALKPAPEFVIATGDLPMGVDGEKKEGFDRLDKCLAMYDGFVNVFKPLKYPLLKVIGNHDCAICLPKNLPEHHKGLYRRYFGPLNYSFDYGDIHFVVLDANIDPCPIVRPGRWKDGTYDVFDKEALAWLEKDLSFQSRSKPIVLFTHQPPYEQKNFDRLVKILSRYNFRGAFAGHWHRNNTLSERTRRGLGPFVVSGALYGGWGGKPCSDGTWRGWRLVAVDGQDVRSCYVAIDRPYQGAILNVNVRHRATHPISGKTEVLMDILDVDHQLKGVGCAINGGPVVAMTPHRRTSMWCRWHAIVDASKVTNGPANLVFTPHTATKVWKYAFPVIVKNAKMELLHPKTPSGIH